MVLKHNCFQIQQMEKRIEVTSTEILSDYFFPLQKVTYNFETNMGEVEVQKREVYCSANGATVLLYNPERGKVILTRQLRIPTFLNSNPSGMMIEACAGILEKNENPEQGILREIEEETGYRVEKVTKLFELYSTPGSVAEMLHYFVAEYNYSQKINEGGGLQKEQENIEVIEMPFEEAFSKIQSGEIKDAKTVILLQYAKLYLLEEEKVFDIL